MGKGMRAGKRPKAPKAPGGGNMQAQLAQMQQVQRMMEETQQEIDKMETTATAGGGAISVTINGAKELTAIKIDPEVVSPDDVEMLEDLVLAAVNEAIRQIEEIASSEMNKITAGLGIPGM